MKSEKEIKEKAEFFTEGLEEIWRTNFKHEELSQEFRIKYKELERRSCREILSQISMLTWVLEQ